MQVVGSLTQKTHYSGRLFEHSGMLFLLTSFHFLLLFLLVVTFVNYFLLLKGGKFNCLKKNLIVEGGRGVVKFYFLKLFFVVEGARGVEVNFLSLSFDLWKKEGRGISFFLKTFFSLLNGYGGGWG
jgi:hypothetical protein